MTAPVLDLMRKRQYELSVKEEREERASLLREIRAAKRRVKVLNECKKMTEAQNRRRAGMANMPVEIYLTRVRYFKERRFECLIGRTTCDA